MNVDICKFDDKLKGAQLVTESTIVREDITICQPEKGFRFSMDSIYLSWFVKYKKNASLVEIGAGSGVISTLLAKLKGFDRLTAIELQEVMFNCLKRTITLNELKINAVNSDIKEYKPDCEFDIAVCNPPYRDSTTGRVPKDEVELNARFTTTMHVDDVFSFCRSYLKNSGSLYLSYDADLTADLFEAGYKYGFEAKRLLPICPEVDVKPKIVLMEFRKNVGREMSFEPPIYQKVNGEQSKADRKIMTGEWI